jgi:DNA-binding CsgD family transcriptional regulator
MKTELLPRNEPLDEASVDLLTGRQHQILNLIVLGHTNREIAFLLQISVRTVEVHRFNLMRKLNVRNVAQLLGRALHLGLLSSSVMRSRSRDRETRTVVRLPIESKLQKSATGHAGNVIKKSKTNQI